MEYDSLKRKKEYYFKQYYNQSNIIEKRRKNIEELNRTKKEILENPIYLKGVKYDDMPHNPNVNIDSIVDGIIKTDDAIDNLNNEIIKQINLLNEELYIFEKIDDMIRNFSEIQSKAFEYLYKDKMRKTEVAYHIDRTERQVLYIKRYIFRKANFIQED